MSQRILSSQQRQHLQLSHHQQSRHDRSLITPSPSQPVFFFTRRDQLVSLLSFGAATFIPDSASALTIAPAGENGFAGLLPPSPPQVITLPRRQIGPAFAVLLLRSGYDTADDLNFIAMERFQRDFWLYRQSEWEPYMLQVAPIPIKQGELSDPNYFDFIAAMQFATISTSMRNGLQTFKEYCGEECPAGTEGDYTLITRDPTLQDNTLLPTVFEERLGDAIYNGLRAGFRGVVFTGTPAPLNPRCSTEELINGVQSLLNVFVEQGYCIKATVKNVVPNPDGVGFSFRIDVDGPAVLWAMQHVTSVRGGLYPVYDALAVASFLRASKRPCSCSFSWTSTGMSEEFRVVF